MVELGRLEGKVKARPSVDVRFELAVWQGTPDLGTLDLKVELTKAYPLAVDE